MRPVTHNEQNKRDKASIEIQHEYESFDSLPNNNSALRLT